MISAYTQASAVDHLKTLSAEELGRTYCALNTWQCPPNLPEQFEGGVQHLREVMGDTAHPYNVWFSAAREALGKDGASRALQTIIERPKSLKPAVKPVTVKGTDDMVIVQQFAA